MTEITYEQALRIVSDFTEGLNGDNPEYERGQLEVLADMFPVAGVDTGDRKDQIERDIRALAAAEASAPFAHIVVMDNGDTEPELWGFLSEEKAEAFADARSASAYVQSIALADDSTADLLIKQQKETP